MKYYFSKITQYIGYLLIGLFFALILLQQYPRLIGHSIGWVDLLFETINNPAIVPVSYHNAIMQTAPSIVHLFEPISSSQDDQIKENKSIQYKSIGSGVIVDEKGWILTNLHVVKKADSIHVLLEDGRQVKAILKGQDAATDLAMLKIDLMNLQAISWIKQQKRIRIGDVVLAIGNPFGLNQSVSMGIVSAIKRNLYLHQYDQFIQTDAAIHPGNSGGALINTSGHLIGITSALFSNDSGNQGLGFAIPAYIAQFVTSQLIQYGHVRRGWIGVEAKRINLALTKQYHLQDNRGVLVDLIVPDSPADHAGIRQGDMILQIDEQTADDVDELINYITMTKPGRLLNMMIIRQTTYQKEMITVQVGQKK
ncbi:MAG: trypsin-like serine protease [Endozoicomonadaceae bacterium]|nr:trypsin-like serine protease [Endozoicomonadaceae bacterium]MBE8233039.1 trypsin-like serine protease [Endozoicomonadaceae bacterium]